MDFKPKKIQLAHGSGGVMMQRFIQEFLLKKLYNPILAGLGDSAVLDFRLKRPVFTTDSFVVNPLFFKGGDIGKLAVCGTLNDLVVAGAIPRFLSLSLIIEEGLDYSILEKIINSIRDTARKERVLVVTGDTKVVEKGACDRIFINTGGLGELVYPHLSLKTIRPRDKIILTGGIGEHGLSVLSGRRSVGLDFGIKSDCNSLTSLLVPLFKKTKGIRFMRDPTRGGLSAALNEIATATGLCLEIVEEDIPLKEEVKATCELLGLDPLYLANEGKAVMVVERASAGSILNYLRKHPLGKDSRIIGEVLKEEGTEVLLRTISGGRRILEPPVEEILPRIC